MNTVANIFSLQFVVEDDDDVLGHVTHSLFKDKFETKDHRHDHRNDHRHRVERKTKFDMALGFNAVQRLLFQSKELH